MQNFIYLMCVEVWLYLASVKSDCDQIYKFLHNTVTDLWAVEMIAFLCVFNFHEA